MLPNDFDYVFVHLKQKARLRPNLSPKYLLTSGPNLARKARADLKLWRVGFNPHPGHVFAFLAETLYDDYLCLAAPNKLQIYKGGSLTSTTCGWRTVKNRTQTLEGEGSIPCRDLCLKNCLAFFKIYFSLLFFLKHLPENLKSGKLLS